MGRAAKTMNQLVNFLKKNDGLVLGYPYSLEPVGTLGQCTSFPENDKLKTNLELLLDFDWHNFKRFGNDISDCVQTILGQIKNSLHELHDARNHFTLGEINDEMCQIENNGYSYLNCTVTYRSKISVNIKFYVGSRPPPQMCLSEVDRIELIPTYFKAIRDDVLSKPHIVRTVIRLATYLREIWKRSEKLSCEEKKMNFEKVIPSIPLITEIICREHALCGTCDHKELFKNFLKAMSCQQSVFVERYGDASSGLHVTPRYGIQYNLAWNFEPTLFAEFCDRFLRCE